VNNGIPEDPDKEKHPDIPNGASGDVDSGICNGSPDTDTRWPLLLPASANNTKSLQSRQEGLLQYIKSHPGRLNDLAYTVALRRRPFTHRSFCIVEDGPVESLEFSAPEKATQAAAQEGSIAYVFTGQGAQWAGMARSLIHDSKAFRSDIREMDKVLQGLPQPPEWTIEGARTPLCLDSQAASSIHIDIGLV
jgi:acyl transferase domain-containing protein